MFALWLLCFYLHSRKVISTFFFLIMTFVCIFGCGHVQNEVRRQVSMHEAMSSVQVNNNI